MNVKLLLLLILSHAHLLAQTTQETYPTDPASQEQAGVPKGEITEIHVRRL